MELRKQMLDAVVKDISTVDESRRDLYVEKDGVHVLNVKPVDGFALENITGLTNTVGTLRHERGQLEDKLKNFKDLDPQAARDALARITDFGDLTPEKARDAIATADRLSKFNPEAEADKLANARFENSKSQLQGQFQARESELTGQITSISETLNRREKQVEKLLKENMIKTELSKQNPLDVAVDLLERMIGDNVKMREVNGEYIVEVVDEKGVPRIKDYAGTPMSVADYVSEMREKKAALFKPDDTRGADLTRQSGKAPASESKNPWVKGPSFSITQQMVLMNTDPNTAKRYMAEAGL